MVTTSRGTIRGWHTSCDVSSRKRECRTDSSSPDERPVAQVGRILWATARDGGAKGSLVACSAQPARTFQKEISIMRLRKSTSRAKQRQEMLRELAADEAVCVAAGPGYSRAAEAVHALERIRDGTYGICVDCRKEIPAARLQVKPEATRCVACQTEYERRSTAGSGAWFAVARRSA